MFFAMQEHQPSSGSTCSKLAVLAVLCLQAGCHSPSARVEPSIIFTKLPPYEEGTAYKLNAIEGRATFSQPGERIVLYAKSGVWWIQPATLQPFTNIQPDGTWKNETHPGAAYAALLVKDGYRPRWKTDQLPGKGGDVLAVTVADGPEGTSRVGKTLLFAGYEWKIRETASNPGGTHNDYDPANSWTDKSGFLHLRIVGAPGHWTSSEVNLRRSLGYGSYRFVVSDVSHLEPAAAFTMLTWADSARPKEMDIEISQWGETATRNGQFVIQPYYVPANTFRFQAPGKTVTFMLRWAPDRAAFRAYRGAVSRWETTPVGEHVFTSGVPAPGDESVHLSLYVFGNNSNPLRHGTEVIVEDFEYLP
jgi:hypothetical protein